LDLTTTHAPDPRWAPGSTLAGQLQRGTGAGYLRALEAPVTQARELLFSCITEDPRWDRQLDSRADYYASLASSVGLDSAPLATYLRQAEAQDEDAPVDLTIETLGALGQRGDGAAVNALRDYLTWGASWDNAFQTLADCGSPDALTGLGQLVCDRFPDDDELTWKTYDHEPWHSWGRPHPRIAAALDRAQAHRNTIRAQQSPDRFLGLMVSELFEHASSENWGALLHTLRKSVTSADVSLLASHLRIETPWHCKLALQGLGFLGSDEAFAFWKQFVEESVGLPQPLYGALHRMTQSAPQALARETGRAWFHDAEALRRSLAHRLLQRSATEDDTELLLGAVGPALKNGDMYRLCSLAEGLARIGASSAWPELAHAFVEAPYSYARGRIAKALIAGAPGRFGEELAPESLWDCEEVVRELASGIVNPEWPGVRVKLTTLAADPHEEEGVRKAATRHLDTFNPQPAG